jgi:hypothetical protein
MHRVLPFAAGAGENAVKPDGAGEDQSFVEFVLFSHEHGVLSYHATAREAEAARWRAAADLDLGDRLPIIIERQDAGCDDAA